MLLLMLLLQGGVRTQGAPNFHRMSVYPHVVQGESKYFGQASQLRLTGSVMMWERDSAILCAHACAMPLGELPFHDDVLA